jgi:hypothetical protein
MLNENLYALIGKSHALAVYAKVLTKWPPICGRLSTIRRVLNCQFNGLEPIPEKANYFLVVIAI